MAPLSPAFATDDLPDRIQFVQKGFKEKRRKGGTVDLEKCALMELVQYSCNPPTDGIQAPGVVKCKPIVRLFRKCAGGLTVETTGWESNKIHDESKTSEIYKATNS